VIAQATSKTKNGAAPIGFGVARTRTSPIEARPSRRFRSNLNDRLVDRTSRERADVQESMGRDAYRQGKEDGRRDLGIAEPHDPTVIDGVRLHC
jgi:hypothetical protein